MLRLAYIVPRLLILLSLCIVLRYGIDPLLKLGGEYFGSSIAGGKVEVGRVSASLYHGSLHFDRIAVTDRSDPMRNLFQFEKGWFQLSNEALLERRLVVPHAVIHGLRFNTPRADSGALAREKRQPSDTTYLREYGDFVTSAARRRAKTWFDDLERRLLSDARSEFQSIELSEQLYARWSATADEARGDVRNWQSKIDEYRELIRAVQQNPLRHLETISQRIGEAQATHRELVEAGRQLAELRGQLQQDKAAVLAAKEHDLQRLRELTQVQNVDPQALAEYLLGDALNEQLNQVLAWVDRGRQIVELSLDRPDINVVGGRGESFEFAQPGKRIGFLVQQLAFSGAADGLEFSGLATEITHRPRAHGVPARIDLKTTGDVVSRVRAEIDLTTQRPSYRITGLCEQLPQPRRMLGQENQFSVEVSPGLAAVRVDLELSEGQLTGDIRWRQDDVKLIPHLGSRYAKLAAVPLDELLRDVDSLHAKVDISGSFSQPQWSLASNVGSQVATGLQAAAEQELQRLADQLLARVDAEIAGQVGKLDTLLSDRAAELTSTLNALQTIQQQLTERWNVPNSRLGAFSLDRLMMPARR